MTENHTWESEPYRLDAQNRIFIPKEVRDALAVKAGAMLVWRVKGKKINLHRVSYKVED